MVRVCVCVGVSAAVAVCKSCSCTTLAAGRIDRQCLGRLGNLHGITPPSRACVCGCSGCCGQSSGCPAGLNQYTLEMRNRELNNGRMAMFAAIGIIAANVYTGKDAIEQFGLA